MRNGTRQMIAGVRSIFILVVTLGLAACQTANEPGGEPAATALATESPATSSADETPTRLPATKTVRTPTRLPDPSPVTTPAADGLVLDAPWDDGSVSGVYHAPRLPDSLPVHFWVTTAGTATFQLEGTPDDDTLLVILGDDGKASMTWAGTTLDGMGALTTQEQAAMTDYFQHTDLLRGLSFIPMDIGCQGDDVIDDQQVAALLFPLQMHFKYQITDRQGTASYLMEHSGCDYSDLPEIESAPSSVIQISPAMPVPVVPGYFPLDEVGAIDSPSITESEKPEIPSLGPDEPTLDVYGPCESKCRGACGADCEPNNCISTAEMRCVKDENGLNTGDVIRVLIYDCGLHQGCIDHDDCYDQCNLTYGCNTWAAAFCRHAQWQGTTQVFETGYCDQRAIEEYGAATAGAWAYGYGPQPMREVFEYTDQTFGQVRHIEKCPVGEAGEEGDAQPAPPATASPTVAGPKWVRDGAPIINAEGLRLEYRGGGSQPDFFSEARFEGTFIIYSVSETQIAVEDRWVDHEWEGYHVNIISQFDPPPAVLVPGESYELHSGFSSSGTMAENGGNPGAQFQYGPDRAHSGIIQPTFALPYYPWAEGWSGPDSQTWTLDAPPAREGESLQIIAFWWNCPVCNVTWNYRAE